MKYTLTHLSVEVTRRCNLSCGHCLRGDKKNLDLNFKKFDRFMSGVGFVESLLLTGGEPLLALDILVGIKKILLKRKTKLGNFSLVTNGTVATDRAVKILGEYFKYASWDGSYVHVSKDNFHSWDDSRQTNYEILKSSLPDVSIDSGNPSKIFMVGKGSSIGNTKPDRSEYAIEIVKETEPKGLVVMGDLFFSATGCVHRDWEMSYNEMDEGVGLIGKVADGYKPAELLSWIKSRDGQG